MTPPMSYSGHVRALLVLGLPLVGGHLAQFAIGLTDTIMLGWYSVEALAAVTLASTLFFIFFIVGSGFAVAVMPMVAAYAGEGDDVSLRRVTRMGLWLSVVFAVLVMPALWWSEHLLLLLGQTDAVAQDAGAYLRIAGWGMMPALLVMVLKSYLAALERTQFVLWITLLAALVNGLANYALIFGNWGASEMGLAGAAIASVCTHLVSLLGVATYAVLSLPEHQIFRRFWVPDRDILARVFRLGVPIGLTNLSEVSLFAASAMMMGWLGTVPLAAHGIAIQVAAAAFMVYLGLSNAATVRAGNAYGRRDRLHLARGAATVSGMSLLVAFFAIALFLLAPEMLISLFLPEDDPARVDILAQGRALLAVAALFQLVDGAQIISLGLLRGTMDTTKPLLIAVFSYFAVGIPSSYLLGFTLGLGGTGVWLGLVVGLFLAAVLLNWRFWRGALQTVGS